VSAPEPSLEEVRRRQRSRALVMGLLLGAFAILLYLITIARMGG
jgi:cytochrome oxidase assembly protein ShyY1